MDQLLCHFQNFCHRMCQDLEKGIIVMLKVFLWRFTESLKHHFDNEKDLSMGFDCLSHGLLLYKMHTYKLSISACKLI